MKLSQLLTPAQILLGFEAADKWDAIRRMSSVLAEVGGLTDPVARAATAALIAREESMTTGMENGVAIPHAALDDLSRLLAVVALVPGGIDFASVDGQPGRILVGLLIPKAEKLQHIRTLAGIAKVLSQADVREQLLAIGGAEEGLEVIRHGEG